MPATFMTVGFNATSALLTWRLSQSSLYTVYTYWPANEVSFATQMFASTNSTFLPNQLDIQNLPAGTAPMNIVLLVISSIKDVSRMCKKIQPVIDKRTLILVDVSGGSGPLQRVVRPHLSKNQVAGIICDINVQLMSQQQPKFEVAQYGDAKSMGPLPACYIEPVAPKISATLATALQSCGVNVQQPKSPVAFSALQWERSIGVIVFELLGVLLGRPSPEELVGDVVAKPIIDGLIGELTSVAQAAGVKGLPSKSQFVKSSPTLVRRARPGFSIAKATRLFEDYYTKQPLPLDFLLLLPILLADELSKSGPTPYLESLYAFSNYLVKLNERPSLLLARATETTLQSQGSAESLAQRFKDLEAVQASLSRSQRELKDLELKVIQREKECDIREETSAARLAKLEEQEQQIQRIVQERTDRAVAEMQRSMAGTIEQQVQARTNAAIAKAKEEMTDSRASSRTSSSGSGHDSDREQSLEQRERALERRERAIVQRERQHQAARAQNGGLASPIPNGMPPRRGPGPGPVPNGNGGPHSANGGQSTPRSNSAPWPMQNGGFPPNGVLLPPEGMVAPPNSNGPPRRRPSEPQAPRPPMSPPLPRSSTNLAGMFNDYSIESSNRGPGRRPVSRAQSVSSVSMYEPTAPPPNARHRPSIPNSATFSQQFQLDGILSLANDRYGMVSRGTRGSSAGLSSDQQQVQRPFIHGTSAHGRNGSVVRAQYPKSSHDSLNDFGSGGSGSGGSSGSVNSVKPQRSPKTGPPGLAYDVYGGYDPSEQQWNSGSGNSQSTLPRSHSRTPPTPQLAGEGSHPSLSIPKLAPIESYPLGFTL